MKILKFNIHAFLIGLSFLLMSCASQVSPTSTPVPTIPPTATTAATGKIVIGDIGDDPSEIIESFQPLADYLAANLTEQGISAGEVRIAPDMETMAAWLENGEVDLYFDSPYPAMIISDLSGAQPILRRWKGGDEQYQAIIFARKEDGLETLADLNGKLIAFDEPFSTSGYMLPIAYMVEAGLKPVEVNEADASIADDEVGYIFTHDDETIIQWVLSGRADAGSTASTDYFNTIPEETREGLVILSDTEIVPRHVVVAAPDLDSDLLQQIQVTLTDMDESDAGRAVLERFEETAKFDVFPQGLEKALQRMRELFDLAQGI